jgi:hypothetical protein
MLQIHSDTKLSYKFKWLVAKSYRSNINNLNIIIEVIKQELTETK